MSIRTRFFIVLVISGFLSNFSLKADWYDNLLSAIEKEQTAIALGIIDQSKDYIRTARLINVGSRKTLLHEAAIKGLTEVVKALIEAGADIQAQDNFGYTAFDRAVMNNHFGAARALLDEARRLEIDIINSPDGHGFTALHRAVMDGNEALVRFLIEQGANPRLRSPLGTPLEIALDYAQRFPVRLSIFVGIANSLRTGLSAQAVVQLTDLRNFAQEGLAAFRQRTGEVGSLLPGWVHFDGKD